MKIPKLAFYCCLLLGPGLTGLRAALVVVDNFSSVSTDGTLLSAVGGWTTTSTTSAVSSAYGYGGGKGAEIITAAEDNRLTLSGPNIMTAASGLVEFKMDFRISAANDGYAIPQILLGKTGGVNGLGIQFNGGTANGSSDNYIQVSSGTGTGWGSLGFTTVANSAWTQGHWYEIDLKVQLLSTGNGQGVSGLLSIYDSTGGAWLFQNVSIAGSGTTGGAFDAINIINFKNNGSGRAFDVANLQIGAAAVPEPAVSALLLGLAAIGLWGLRQNKHRR